MSSRDTDGLRARQRVMRLSMPTRMATSVACAPIVRAAKFLPVSTFKRYISVLASERR